MYLYLKTHIELVYHIFFAKMSIFSIIKYIKKLLRIWVGKNYLKKLCPIYLYLKTHIGLVCRIFFAKMSIFSMIKYIKIFQRNWVVENIFLKNIVPYICFLKPTLSWYIVFSLKKRQISAWSNILKKFKEIQLRKTSS